MRIWYLLLLMCAAPVADAEMWKCVDQDGNTRYTNLKADAKGCKGLNLEPMNTTPAPARPQQKPANFPSVDSDTQRSRDAGRRKILEQELAQEQQQLEVEKKQLAEQKEMRLGNERNYARFEERLKPYEDKIKQHELNLESLKKELANTK
jgi:chromosome segregation ATPase